MNNEQLLRAVQAKLATGEMRRAEVEQMLQTIPRAGKKGWNFSVTSPDAIKLSPCFCAIRDGFYSKTPTSGLTMQTDGISIRS